MKFTSRRHKRKFIRLKGFTLIELAIVIVVLGIVSMTIGEILYHAAQSVSVAYDVSKIGGQTRIALERMAREMRMIRSADDLITHTGNNIEFYDINGDLISYLLSGTNLQRNSKVLSGNISAIPPATSIFAYYNSAGTQLNETALNPSEVKYIKAEMRATENDNIVDLQTIIFLRNVSS